MDPRAEVLNLAWLKSSYSEAGNCVEVASLGDQILIRDSKHRDGPMLNLSSSQWEEFLCAARDGRFDID
jgi:hypothetical protein